MSCSEDRIIAFLAGELSDEDERRFDGHLLHCEDCWRAVQADRTARFALEKLREPAPAGLQDRMALAVSLAAPEVAPDKAGCRPARPIGTAGHGPAGNRAPRARSQLVHCPGCRDPRLVAG